MDTESCLKNLLERLKKIKEDYDKEGFNSFEDSCFADLKTFINYACNSAPLKRKNRRIIVDHFDEILPYINQSNLSIIWENFAEFIKYKNLKKKFIQGLYKYPYKKGIYLLIYNIRAALHNNDKYYNYLVDKELLNVLISLGVDDRTYISVLDYANQETQKELLNELINKKIMIYYESINYKGTNKKIIFDNIDKYMESSQNLYGLMKFVEEDDNALEKVKTYINNNEEKAINSIFLESKDQIKIKDDVIKDVITMIIKEIKNHENANYSDIKFRSGGFSRVLIIGNKVIKIGNRSNANFPNNPYILSPLMRRELKTENDSIFVEVTERVETKEMPTLEDMYNVYKKLRDLGLIWTDIRPQNLGKLIKDNEIYWNKNLEPSNEALEFYSSRGTEKLKKGDWILLDADFIYDENDPNINYTNNKHLSDSFEKRYQEEKLNINKPVEVIHLSESSHDIQIPTNIIHR